VKVTATVNGTTPWWTTDPEGPAFEAARSALKAGFGKEAAMMGAGGTSRSPISSRARPAS
jgi:hypothetical protein